MEWITHALDELNPLDRLRRALRSSELLFLALALLVGIIAGLLTVLQSTIAHSLQQWAYNLTPHMRLSAVEDIPLRDLWMLPLGGLLLGLFTVVTRARKRALVDAVEANALHGGRMSMRDSLIVSGQTLLSNGFGASVGLEAAYVQMGSGAASSLGQRLHLRRADQRTLVGAGAGAAIAAAFGAPLTGAFYAFEIVIGTYAPTLLAPVAAAVLGAVSVALAWGSTPYLISVAPNIDMTSRDYALALLLAAICALVGIALMRLVALVERSVNATRLPYWLRPMVGGLMLIPLAAYTPQIMSAGHGALSNDLVIGYSTEFVVILLLVKCAASVVSLGFGFRGGLFFASLFLGALLGHVFADMTNWVSGRMLFDEGEGALIGMAALAVGVVGGPLTLSMLVLEATHDFALTGAVIAGAMLANTIVRSAFGYSFSTWRLHLRGASIRSARDVGWANALTAAQLMRRDTRSTPASIDVAEFRRRFPLGSASRVVLVDDLGRYAGIALPVTAHADGSKPDMPIVQLACNRDRFVRADTGLPEIMKAFDAAQTDELAVVDHDGRVLGILSEARVRKRYADELEKHQRELYGEPEEDAPPAGGD